MKRKTINKTRFFIYFIAVLLFAAVSAFFIFSAMGYELKFEKKEIVLEKTGMIILSSKPTGADVYIDGNKSDQRTNLVFSVKIDKLHEGTYDVRIEKAGFYIWEKKAEVLPEIVTWVNYVLLFSKDPRIEKSVVKGSFQRAFPSSDFKQSIILATNRGNSIIYLLDNGLGQYNEVFNTALMSTKSKLRDIRILEWSKDRRSLLLDATVGKTRQTFVLDVSSGGLDNLSSVSASRFDFLAFNDVSSKELFGVKSKKLYRINITTDEVSGALEDSVADVVSEGDRIYFVKEGRDNAALWQMNSDGSSKTVVYDGLPKEASYKTYVSPKGNRIGLIVGNRGSLYLLDTRNGKYEVAHLKDGVSDLSWSPDGKRLYIKNGKTIFVSDFEEKESMEVGKISHMKNVRWYDSRHFVLQKDMNAAVMDFDGTNIIPLGQNIFGSPVLFGENRDIYFFSPSAKVSQFTLNRYKPEF